MNGLVASEIRPEDISREQAHTILERASDEAKRRLAQGSDAPEILSYLSKEPNGEIRALVAGNTATPRQIDLELADDVFDQVRIQLAQKISHLLPELCDKEATRVRDLALKIIEKLAADNLPRVRQIVAEEIKFCKDIPQAIIDMLVRDAEITVAAPVLENSPLLSDEDLLQIIATSEVEGVLAAIAKRWPLSYDVSQAVAETLDVAAVATLLANQNVDFGAAALDRIAEHARNVEAWHKPLVLRTELSIRAVRRISDFVASSLLKMLSQRHGLDDETREHIALKVRARLQQEDPARAEADQIKQTWALVTCAAAEGKLGDDFVLDAIRSRDRLRAVGSLVVLGRVPEAVVERILKSGSAKLITSFAWHAGLRMRTAFELQKSLAKLNPSDLLPARNGVEISRWTRSKWQVNLSSWELRTRHERSFRVKLICTWCRRCDIQPRQHCAIPCNDCTRNVTPPIPILCNEFNGMKSIEGGATCWTRSHI